MSIDTIMNEFKILRTKGLPSEKLDDQYADLMIQMEQTYQIPDVITGEWEQDNRPVSTLYRMIARSRLMET